MAFLPAILLSVGAILALVFGRRQSAAHPVGCAVAVVGCLLTLGIDSVTIARCFVNHSCEGLLDPLFRLPIALVGGCAALHSVGYLKGHGEERAPLYWFLYNLTLAAMLTLTVVRSFWHFALCWEFMGLFSAGLVGFDWHNERVRKASWIYLVACHAGILFLIAFFALRNLSPLVAVIFLLLGFGLKAGFPTLHIWLPEAHPAAPAPVSALMSAAMINLGLYGILRFLPWCNFGGIYTLGWVLVILGAVGALGGIIFALSQYDIKRLLAFSSIENIGIMTLAGGLGFLGEATQNEPMRLLAFLGAGCHMLNHALLKGGLFLGAGSVYKATGTLNADLLGGLAKRLPRTATIFLLNSIGLSGLPPMNGFLGEFLIYLALFTGMSSSVPAISYASIALMIILALTGGFASLAFAKLYSSVFQGEPRTTAARSARETPWIMILPQGILLACSVIVTLLFAVVPITFPDGTVLQSPQIVARLSLLLVVITAFLLCLRRVILPRSQSLALRPTWDCGYAEPTARMAYTGTAFAQPATDFLSPLTAASKSVKRRGGIFPTLLAIETRLLDLGVTKLWHPIFTTFGRLAKVSHRLQAGYLHLYILIMTLAVLAMLIWGFGFN